MTTAPHNPEVELEVIGRLLRDPALTGQVVGTMLEAAHFHSAAHRLLYEAVVERFYADEPIDAMMVGELNAKRLAKMWQVEEQAAVKRVIDAATRPSTGSPVDHAKLIKRDADYRALLKLADDIRDQVHTEDRSPEEIAGTTSVAAMRVATAQEVTQEIVSFADAGRGFVRDARHAIAAREAGIELGAHYGLQAIDQFTNGQRPGELLIAGGEPGVGKSAVWWRAGLNFATRQQKRPRGERIGTMVISLEMGPSPSNARFASMLAGIAGTDIRRGEITASDVEHVVARWRERVDTPLWLNYAPTLRASQLRALISEGIRRHNIGVVIIDHFRMFDLDRRLQNKNDEDEEKVRFLKEQIALSLNVAVICLAHTRKPDPGSSGRPKMSDLRGSYQVAAHSDFVSFIFRPSMYASQAALDSGEVNTTDAEMLWPKNRHGDPGAMQFYFNAKKMLITD